MEHNQNKSLDELLELKVHRIEQTLNEFNVIKKHGDVDTIIAKVKHFELDDALTNIIRFEICVTDTDAFKFAVKLMCTRLNKALLDDNSSRPLCNVAVEHMMQLVQQSLQSSMHNLHDVKQIEASCALIVYNSLLVNFQQHSK